jgi:hypothetical protein
MFSRSAIPIFVVLWVFLTAGPLLMPAEAGGGSVTGKVKDVDLREQSVIVGGPGGDMAVYVDDRTRISKGGAARSLGRIKVGSIVRIEYRSMGADLIANTISLSP